MALNIITAKFCSGSNQTWTDEAWQYDYGQVLRLEGLELPDAYEVHFSNAPINGNAKPQIGNADGVEIPDEYFESGEPIYAWLFLHQGEDDGETEKMVTIPIKKRSKEVNEQPTPVEQSAITQAIAALNIAVEKAEDAIEHYPQIIDGTWHVWDVTEEEYVDTDVQAQGEQGQPGTDGTDGQDGFSPVITVTDITGGHRVTITDATGTQTFDVMNGQDGQPGTPGTDGTDGYSPTVTVTEITGGHRVTITDAQGAHTFDVMDGQGGSVTVDDELSDTSENPVQNKIITEAVSQLNEDITDLETALDGKVDDVQVNGTSVVNQGVANVPLADAYTAGVLQIGADYGITKGSSSRAYLSKATDAQLKAGEQIYKPVVSSNAHVATFYGLAKAASDTTQSASSNAVGNYTDAAKVAIQKMLGVYREWEFIAEVTTTEDLAELLINTDTNGQSFELSEMVTRVKMPPTTTGTRDYVRTEAKAKRSDGVNYEGASPAVYYPSATGGLFVELRHAVVNDFCISEARYSLGESSSAQIVSSSFPEIDSIYKMDCLTGVKIKQYNSSSTLIPAGTKIKVYGIRV